MRRRLIAIAVTALVAALTGCGNKGDLVLPDKTPPAADAPAAPAT
jgi:predicted small lipoprotein YifL